MLVFDTHKFYERLEKAGLSKEVAETVTDLVRETQESSFEEIGKTLATKTDLVELRPEFKADLATTQAELKSEIIKWIAGSTLTVLLFNIGLALTIIKVFLK